MTEMHGDLQTQIGALHQGDHVCLLYENAEEQARAAVPYVKQGLVRGEYCVYIANDLLIGDVARRLGEVGIDVDEEVRRGRLLLATKREAYLRTGAFEPDAMIDFLGDATARAVREGFSGLRVTGEMAWALGEEVETDLLVEYEAKLNRFFPSSRASAICQYNRTLFPPDIVLQVLRTHPQAIVGDEVCANLFYEPHWMVLGEASAQARVDWMVGRLSEFRSSQKRLEELNERLREEDRSKDEFLAMLAHELRNPLGVLTTSLQVLRTADKASGSWARALGAAERQVKHQTRIVDSLLDLSRITRNKIDLRREPVDLRTIVRAAEDDHAVAAEKAGVSLSHCSPSVAVTVSGDVTRLSQILANLVENAIKFTPAGGSVTVALAKDENEAVLSVADSGVGIETSLLPHVFGTFKQADHSLDRSKGGLGLGLAVAKGLAELHGGTIRAFSDGLGCGTRFEVRLPIAEPSRAGGAAGEIAAKARAHRRVLVVDDNVDAADSLQELLGILGHHAAVAYRGADAIEAVRCGQHDLVFCDIGLPDLDGYEVARRVRASGYRDRLVAVSGYGMERDRQRSKEAGFDEHVVKPLDPAVLERLLA